MTPEYAIELLKSMIYQALTIAAPILIAAMIVGLAVIGVLLVLLPWIMRSLIEFTVAIIQKLPEMVQ